MDAKEILRDDLGERSRDMRQWEEIRIVLRVRANLSA